METRTRHGRRQGLIERPDLVARLRGATAPLAAITAPAGYGKSTLIDPWAEADERDFARAMLLLDDAEGAREQLALAGRRIELTPDAEKLRNWIAAGWTEAEAVDCARSAGLLGSKEG